MESLKRKDRAAVARFLRDKKLCQMTETVRVEFWTPLSSVANSQCAHVIVVSLYERRAEQFSWCYIQLRPTLGACKQILELEA